MIQDRELKASALRFAVAKRWFPQVELDVSTYITVGKKPTNITDIDVFASVPDDFVGFRSVVIDCKTKKGESPISRAMWQRGIMARVGADRGICVLRTNRIETDHRYTAAQLGITLLAEKEFPAFMSATTHPAATALGAIAEIDRWDAYFEVGRRFIHLAPAIAFSRSGFWMSDNEAEACTRTIFLVTALRGELDPERPEHLAVVSDLTALFLHSLARIVVRVFAAYLQPEERGELSRALLFLLYGGRNAYDHLNRIRRMIVGSREAGTAGHEVEDSPPIDSSHSSESQSQLEIVGALATADPAQGTRTEAASSVRSNTQSGSRRRGRVPSSGSADQRDLSLPEWDRFVELTRQMLDAPLEVNRAPLIMRELAWAALGSGTGGSDGVTQFARTLAAASPQGARFAVLGLDYLCRAARLPREFSERITSRLLAAQSR